MDLLKRIEDMREDMIEALKKFVSINSVNPGGGGPGEKEKADWLETLLKDLGYPIVERYDVVDDSGYTRSNVVAKIPGRSEKNLWIVTHIDTVPPGDLKAWKYDPFDPVVEDDKIYGRGSEDNGGSMIASIYAGKALMDLSVEPKMNYSLVLVADEEYGSEWGIEYLIEKGIFKEGDLFLVPDAGNSRGDFIEVAEKSILWMEIEVVGKQTHASTPEDGKNAFRKGAQIVLGVDRALHERFSKKDELFHPPESTFEPTKVEKTVDNVNTIPGKFIFCIDCRVLPDYDLNDVIETIEGVIEKEREDFNVITRVLQRLDAPKPTPPDSEIVLILKEAIKRVRGIDAIVGGIGGGTCAAHFRKRGWHAAVWSTIDGTAHQPNEYKRISHMIEDAKVFAELFRA